jgi:hypothetical protein
MGIEALFAFIAFMTLGFLWVVLPNAELATEGSPR